jgi:hypothetical protein
MATVQELFKNDQYKYDPKQTPKYNYELFQQAISFGQGAEFLRTSNFRNKPVLLLLQVPGLSTDLTKAEKTLNSFNQQILFHLSEFLNKSKNHFEIFMHFYELYKAVFSQQEEYKDAKDKFFASTKVMQYNIKDIRKLHLPIVRTNYKGLFLEILGAAPQAVAFNKIGTEGKEHFEKLYLLRRRYNKNLLKDLTELKTKLFREKSFTRQYKYQGEIADLLEVALALIRSEKVKPLNGGGLNEELFAKDLCLFLGKTFSKISSNQDTINKRILRKISFLHRSIKALSGV